MSRDFAEIRKRATRPTRTVVLCVDGEAAEQIAELERQLAGAKPPTSLGEVSPKRAIAEQIAELQEQMREATVEFHLRAFAPRAWAVFWAEKPERGEQESAEAWADRVFPWYAQLISKSCVDPEMSPEQVGELEEMLHSAAWIRLVNSCILLNSGQVDVPNFDAASELTGDSEQT